MGLDGVETYCHDLELHVASTLTGEELLVIVAIANDAEFLVDALDAIEDDYSDLIERRNLEDTFSHVIHRCQKLGQLALHRLCDIIFADLATLETEMFNKDWIEGSTDTTDTMFATIEDYFGDFYGKLKTRAFVSLAGYCYNHMVVFYVRRLIETFTKQHSRTRVRSEIKTRPNQEAMNMVSRDLENMLHTFQMILKGSNCGSPDREYKDRPVFRMGGRYSASHKYRDVHAGVFLSMCTVLKSQNSPLSSYTLSHLPLLRDFNDEHKRWRIWIACSLKRNNAH